MAYEPQPGTIAFRAIAWLTRQPKGTEVTSSVWGEAIDVEGNTLTVCIKPAVDAGLVKRSTRDGLQKPFWFSLGSGEPASPPAPEGEDTQDPLPARRTAPEVKPLPGALLPGGVRGVEPVEPAPPLKVPKFTGRVPQPADDPVVVAADAKALPFNACRYIDGSVIVVGVEVRGDGAIIFSPKQAASLWRLRDAA